MKKIPLTNSKKKAIVDDEDYEWLSRYTWFLDKKTGQVTTLICGIKCLMCEMVLQGMQSRKN